MVDLPRPRPPEPWWTRAGRVAQGLVASRSGASVARAVAVLGAVLLVASVGWWLVRPSAVPVEDHLPTATDTGKAGSAGGGAAGSSSGAGGAGGAGGPSGAAGSSGGGAAPTGGAPSDTVVVQAAGAVVVPGVYRLPAGSRITDLLAAAGGPRPDADPQALALASRLVDGQRVQVPRVGEAPPASSASSVDVGPLDLNTASVEALDKLPGVGPATAQAIVARRERYGPYRSVEGLLDVPGIGPAKLEAFRDLVTVSS
jgi:competence protein ComEA